MLDFCFAKRFCGALYRRFSALPNWRSQLALFLWKKGSALKIAKQTLRVIGSNLCLIFFVYFFAEQTRSVINCIGFAKLRFGFAENTFNSAKLNLASPNCEAKSFASAKPIDFAIDSVFTNIIDIILCFQKNYLPFCVSALPKTRSIQLC